MLQLRNYQTKMKQKENWIPCLGFEGNYEVSDLGNIRRKLAPTVYKDGRVAYFSQTVLKPSVNHKGYYKVHLSVGSKKHSRYLHRLIAQSFLKNEQNKETVNHKNCIKTDNRPCNLEWMTNIENMNHAFQNGIYKERDKTTIYNIKHMRDKLCR